MEEDKLENKESDETTQQVDGELVDTQWERRYIKKFRPKPYLNHMKAIKNSTNLGFRLEINFTYIHSSHETKMGRIYNKGHTI